jgi:hypothetical protein
MPANTDPKLQHEIEGILVAMRRDGGKPTAKAFDVQTLEECAP